MSSRRFFTVYASSAAVVGGILWVASPVADRAMRALTSSRYDGVLLSPTPPPLQRELAAVAATLGTTLDRVDLMVVSKLFTPAASGSRIHPFSRALLVVPESMVVRFIVDPAADSLSAMERFQLAHELAHIRNEDHLRQGVLDYALFCVVTLVPAYLRTIVRVPVPVAAAAGVFGAAAAIVAHRAFSRQTELRADAAAARGGHAAGGIEFFYRVGRALEESKSDSYAARSASTSHLLASLRTVLRDHPSVGERMATVAEESRK